MKVVTSQPKQLSKSTIEYINELVYSTWPESPTASLSTKEKIKAFFQRNPGKLCHMVYDGKELIAYSESAPRKIVIALQDFEVMALSCVCVNPKYRGKGLGALIVRAAFDRVDKGEFSVSLFQTGVPEFYTKLDCKHVENQFIDSTNPKEPEKNPFWDDHVMIYPKHFLWPTGRVDILGKGF